MEVVSKKWEECHVHHRGSGWILVARFQVRAREGENKNKVKHQNKSSSVNSLMISSCLFQLPSTHRYGLSRAIRIGPTRMIDKVEEILHYTAPSPGLLARWCVPPPPGRTDVCQQRLLLRERWYESQGWDFAAGWPPHRLAFASHCICTSPTGGGERPWWWSSGGVWSI